MLSIILNNVFTRNRKDMAAAEKARGEARRHQRFKPHKSEADAPAQPVEAAAAETKPEKS